MEIPGFYYGTWISTQEEGVQIQFGYIMAHVICPSKPLPATMSTILIISRPGEEEVL